MLLTCMILYANNLLYSTNISIDWNTFFTLENHLEERFGPNYNPYNSLLTDWETWISEQWFLEKTAVTCLSLAQADFGDAWITPLSAKQRFHERTINLFSQSPGTYSCQHCITPRHTPTHTEACIYSWEPKTTLHSHTICIFQSFLPMCKSNPIIWGYASQTKGKTEMSLSI